MIIVDSREKKWDHIRAYFDKHGIEYVFPQKLDTGDYFNTEYPVIVVDRKANLQELCGNLSKGSGNIVRFTAECRRAKENRMKIVVLIEGTGIRTIKELERWKSKYTKHTGRWLSDKMWNLTVSYDVEWQFCKKTETAKKILEILKYDSRRDKTDDLDERCAGEVRSQSEPERNVLLSDSRRETSEHEGVL